MRQEEQLPSCTKHWCHLALATRYYQHQEPARQHSELVVAVPAVELVAAESVVVEPVVIAAELAVVAEQ